MAAASPLKSTCLQTIKEFQKQHAHHDCLGKEVNIFFEKLSSDLTDGSADYLMWSKKSFALLESTDSLLKNFESLVQSSTKSYRNVPSGSPCVLVSAEETKKIAEALVECLTQLTQDLKKLERSASTPELGTVSGKQAKPASPASSASLPDASAMAMKVRLFPPKFTATLKNKPAKPPQPPRL